MAFIRQYQPSDFEATANICVETLAPSLLGSEPAARIGPYLWTHQYTHLSPTTSFILDDGSGRAVGYCIGCPDIPTFISNYPKFVSEVLSKGPVPRPEDISGVQEPWTTKDGSVNETALAQQAYNPEWLIVKGNEDLIYEKAYKGTMHIDLLPEWQGKGWGRKLIERFLESVKREGAKGVSIGVAGDNGKVVGFYEKLGFKVVEGKGEGIRMVRDLD